MNENVYQLSFPSDPNELPEVELFAEKIADLAKLTEDQKGTLGLIVTEAVNNSIYHGNHCDRNLLVHIQFEILPSEIIITVKDSGKGFDPTLIPDPTQPENLLKEHGRGWLILKHFCKDVITEVVDDGFITRLIFSRSEG
ncbi:MAG: ATP-binding protein [bacterium]|nr:ATP-binding protein [bacterium]